MIITIARQCGCGGHEVARILANKLGNFSMLAGYAAE